jgi:hypothetical protein
MRSIDQACHPMAERINGSHMAPGSKEQGDGVSDSLREMRRSIVFCKSAARPDFFITGRAV